MLCCLVILPLLTVITNINGGIPLQNYQDSRQQAVLDYSIRMGDAKEIVLGTEAGARTNPIDATGFFAMSEDVTSTSYQIYRKDFDLIEETFERRNRYYLFEHRTNIARVTLANQVCPGATRDDLSMTVEKGPAFIPLILNFYVKIPYGLEQEDENDIVESRLSRTLHLFARVSLDENSFVDDNVFSLCNWNQAGRLSRVHGSDLVASQGSSFWLDTQVMTLIIDADARLNSGIFLGNFAKNANVFVVVERMNVGQISDLVVGAPLTGLGPRLGSP